MFGRPKKNISNREKFPFLHVEWERETHGEKRRFKIVLGPIVGAVILAAITAAIHHFLP